MFFRSSSFHYFCAMTDKEIIEGLKRGDSDITRRYFYGYCRMAYSVCDQRYDLHSKTDMDFYSLAHDYYMRLLTGGWKQLDAKRPEVKLSTWMTNGFRFVVLDKLKVFHSSGEELNTLRFDLPDDNFSEEVRTMLEDVIDSQFKGDRRSQGILRMILLGGYKSKEVAEQLGTSASAVSQRYRKMMDTVVIPYFKHHYESESAGNVYGAAMDICSNEAAYGDFSPVGKCYAEASEYGDSSNWEDGLRRSSRASGDRRWLQRVTPEMIKSLGENEIFVFGSNLAGMHGGGAAYVALKLFGAKLGQGVGLQGQSYAIPTMQGGVETIWPYVEEFTAFARSHEELHFLVTRVGCGVAGFDPTDIAPLFGAAAELPNIWLPRDFWEVLG